jgi:hypothetical protein
MDDFLKATEAMIAAWHGVAAPNEQGRRLADDLQGIIRNFARLRGTIAFEDEPSSFEAALQATKEGA